jgi:membrane protein DedA with SNARE-associated domain
MSEITQFLLSHGGPVLFAVVLVEQAGLPIPAAPWLLAAGALSASGKLNLLPAIAVSALACVIADAIWFYVGRQGGERALGFFCRLSLAPNSCVGRTEGIFARHGMHAVVAAKFLPGFGAVMPPLAGAFRVHAGRFLLFDTIGSLIYGAFYILIGFFFHSQLQEMTTVLSQLGFSTLLLVLFLVAGYIGFKYVRRRKVRFGRTHPEETETQIENLPVAPPDVHQNASAATQWVQEQAAAAIVQPIAREP